MANHNILDLKTRLKLKENIYNINLHKLPKYL